MRNGLEVCVFSRRGEHALTLGPEGVQVVAGRAAKKKSWSSPSGVVSEQRASQQHSTKAMSLKR